MMKNNRGFIAIPLVLSIIIFATAVVYMMYSKYSSNSYLMVNIAQNVKKRLATTKNPNCVWGPSPFMKIFGTNDASSSMLLTCSHMDGIETDLQAMTDAQISNYIKILDQSGNPTTNFKLKIIKVNDIVIGYRIAFDLRSGVVGKYQLRLIEGKICTNDGYCNTELTSSYIEVE